MVILSRRVPASTNKSLWWEGDKQQVFVRACVRERRDLSYEDILICTKWVLLPPLMILLVAGDADPLTQNRSSVYWAQWVCVVWAHQAPNSKGRGSLCCLARCSTTWSIIFSKGGCWDIDFSVTWVYAFIVLASCPCPCPKGEPAHLWDATEMPFSSTVCGLWHLGGLSKTAGEIFTIFHLQRGEVAPHPAVVVSHAIPGGRVRNEPTLIYFLIAFLLGWA